MMFTPEELEELRRADAEIDENFRLTNEEIQASRKRDRESVVDRKDNHGKKIADYQAAWFQKNREKWNAYQREYRKRKAASRLARSERRQEKKHHTHHSREVTKCQWNLGYLNSKEPWRWKPFWSDIRSVTAAAMPSRRIHTL